MLRLSETATHPSPDGDPLGLQTGAVAASAPGEELEERLAKLPPRRAAFVAEYLADLNGTQAAIRAGYSRQTAKAQAPRLLSNVDVQQAIAAAKRARAERLNITADRVIRELARIGLTDMRDYTRWGPDGLEVKDSASLTDDQARAVLAVKSHKRTVPQRGGDAIEEITVEVKLHDKLTALDKLGRHLGVFEAELVKPEDVQQFLDAVLQVFQKWLPEDQVMPALLDLKALAKAMCAGQCEPPPADPFRP